MPFIFVCDAMEKARKSFIELLYFRNECHILEEEYRDGDKKMWRLVLRDSVNNQTNSVIASNYDITLCSGCGGVPQDVSDKRNIISSRLSKDLAIFTLEKETNDEVYYVLSDQDKKGKVIDATSITELECHGKILHISKGQDPPEAIFCEILKSYFGCNKKTFSNLDKRYIQIVRNGDVQNLKKEVFEAANIKCAIDENGWTMLHYAAYYGNLEILSFLISVCCDMHAQDNVCGRKPVMIAAREGHIDVIEVFLLQGLSVNEADSMGWTLLHYAVWRGNSNTVRFLIQKKAQINVKDKCSGKTPLHVAAEEGYLELVKLLLSSSNIEETTNKWETPLHFAAFEGFLDIVKFLSERKANIHAVDENFWTPLHLAAEKGHLDIVEFLVDRGADLHATDEDIWTPLHLAVDKGHLDIVKFLVDKGANLHATGEGIWTPLHLAANKGHLDIAEFIVNRGADIHATDEDSWTPLHLATSEGHLKVVEFLVDSGADLHATDEDSWTPLHLAAIGGHLKVVEFLVERGADFNAKDKEGNSLIHFMKNEIVGSCHKMLNFIKNQGRFKDALKLYRELLEHQIKNLGFVHPETLTTRKNIAKMLYDQCQYFEAFNILNEVSISDRDLCSNDFTILRLRCELRLLLSETNEGKNMAEELLTEMLNIMEAYSDIPFQQTVMLFFPEQGDTEDITLIPDRDETVDAGIPFNQAFALIPEQDEKVEMVKEDISKNELKVGNGKNTIFKEARTADYKKENSIYVCMFLFCLMFSIICRYAIYSFQQ